MVLRPRESGLALAVLLLVIVLSGCIQGAKTDKLPQPADVQVALVMSYADKPDVERFHADVTPAVHEALGARNLVRVGALSEPVLGEFQRRRETGARVEQLAAKAQADGDPFVLLVEATPRFYSLLSGRYRWEINLRVTIADSTNPTDALSEDWVLTAFLDYGHQDHADALIYSAPAIADRVGRVVDRFLTSWKQAPPPASSTSTPTALAPGAVIYFVMVDRFHNGDPSNDESIDRDDPQAFHGGDLQGVADKLDWLEQLGVTSIWLSPIFEMRDTKFHGHGAFHGYWTEDLGTVESRFGGAEALSTLRTAARERGMSLILDMVLNHVGPESARVDRQPDWFHHNGGITDWNDVEQLTTHDVHGLPDLAQENPEVARFLMEASDQWIKRADLAGFRLDAVKHVPNDFWRRYGTHVRDVAKPGFVLIGEDFQGNPALVAETMREGGFDAIFDFPMYYALTDVFCRDAHPGRIAAILSADRLYGDTVGKRREGLVTLLDNHDLPRILSSCQGDVARVVDAVAFLFSMRGTPSITWGTESGAIGVQEPDNRADMRFEPHPVGAALKRWVSLRRQTRALTHGKDVVMAMDDRLLVVGRTTASESVVVAVNMGSAVVPLELPDGDWRELGKDSGEGAPTARPGVTAWHAASALTTPNGEARITFVVDGAPDGELRIVGSGPELGNWDPHSAPSADKPVRLPQGAVFAFKPVVLKNGDVHWPQRSDAYLLVGADQQVAVSWTAN